MKVSILAQDNKNTGSIELPAQFHEPVRPDLIQKAVETIQANNRTPYGADPEAGKRHSTKVSKRRRKYRGCYGIGISRVPRKVHSRSGTRMNWTGALSPGCVGGRRAHPPKAGKDWHKKINKKENRMAIRSAIAASINKELVSARGHKTPEKFPFIIGKAFEDISKTQDLQKALQAIGLTEELQRCSIKKVRSGHGKKRGRKYKKRKGPLVVTGTDAKLSKLTLPGVDIVRVDMLNAQLLAPSSVGRLTLYTETAIQRLTKEKLFTRNYTNEKAREENKKKAEVKEKAATNKKAKKQATPVKPAKKKVAKAAPKEGTKPAQKKEANQENPAADKKQQAADAPAKTE
jgi:large subunit ribosomal protein L4e